MDSSRIDAGEQIRNAASQAVLQGADIRAKVRDLTLQALQQRRFDRQGLRDVVRATSEGIALGAEQSRSDMRVALADAFAGLDQAITQSAQAGQEALRQLAAQSRDFSDHEFRQALANLRRIEDDFLATLGLVADGASAKVAPELRRMLDGARTQGTQTGKQVALMLGEFAQRFGAASLDVTIAGVQAAGEYGARFAMLAGGVLAGVADALRRSAPPPPGPAPTDAAPPDTPDPTRR